MNELNKLLDAYGAEGTAYLLANLISRRAQKESDDKTATRMFELSTKIANAVSEFIESK